MNQDFNMTVSPVVKKNGKNMAFVTFSNGDLFAEGTIPDCKIIKNKGFNNEEIGQLEEYMARELTSLKRMAAGNNVLKALMK